MTLNLVFVEASLELVPSEILVHPSVRRNAKRRGKKPGETILDRSLHHHAMTSLKDQEKRGRPDILHISLLEAMGSPLNKTGNLRVWVSTQQDYIIEINPSTRFPRDYNRFKSLMEQLFIDGSSPAGDEISLLKLKKLSLRALVDLLGFSRVVVLSRYGSPSSFTAVVEGLIGTKNQVIFVGAYPKGPMEEGTLALADEVLSIYPEPLEAWIVVSRLLYEYEMRLGLF